MKINRFTFFNELRKWIGPLKTDQVTGLGYLLTYIEEDPQSELQEVAYELATIYHETGATFLPIKEFGRGRGRVYGVVDKDTGQIYYGRGYVQLTWKKNYQYFTDRLGIDFINNPDAVMVFANSYTIMTVGMREGKFTGIAFNNCRTSNGLDYIKCRRIINGNDKSIRIKDYAVKFQSILEKSVG